MLSSLEGTLDADASAFSATGRSRASSAPAPVSRSARIPAVCLAASTADHRAPASPTTRWPTVWPTSRAAPAAGPTSRSSTRRAYTLDGFRLGTIGSAARGDCTGPGYFQTDLAFYKNFPLKNGMKLQFRWDIFNIFNNTNFLFQNIDNTMDPSAVVLNAAQTEIVSATIPASFGQATRTRDPRQMQIGFKLLW